MSIGEQLRQTRQTREISLDQAAQATHIRLRYLEALEADQFDQLPSSAQVRGFIRAYADYLKLDSAELIHQLDGSVLENRPPKTPERKSPENVPGSDSADVIFMELGEKLRSQRELMGLTLGDVERHTHIREHYVRALEEGDISHLPSPVQGRGMLSNYASFLGLNTEAVLLRFADGLQASLYTRQEARNQGQTKSSRDESGRMPARPSQVRRLFSMDLFAGGFIIIFLLGFAIWGGLRISNLRSDREPSPTAPPVSELLLSTQGEVFTATMTLMPTGLQSPVSTLIVDVPILDGTLPAEETAETTLVVTDPALQNAPLQISIVARQHVWVRITVDGEVVFQDRIMPGSAYSFYGDERIDLLAADGSALQVYFNQLDLGILGSFGEVVERVFSIQGVQTATPAVPPTRTPEPTATITPTPSATLTGLPATPSPTPNP